MAIADKLTQLNTIKGDIKAAIIAKGGTATDDFTTYATAIENLPSGGGDEVLRDLIERDITSITIPSGTTTIGDGAFNGCTGLTSIEIPDSVTSIGSSAFYKCYGLTSITIPDSVTSIGSTAFGGNEYSRIPYRSLYITDLAAWCNITISDTGHPFNSGSPNPDGGSLYLNNVALTDLVIPNTVTAIKHDAFYACRNLTSITIPDSVTSIGSSAFYCCTGLTSVTIGNSVTTINSYAFQGCSGLTSITIGSSVTSIANYAFRYCSSLTSITCLATTPPTILSNTFQNVPSTCPIYVPAQSVEAYQAASNWKTRAEYIQAIP